MPSAKWWPFCLGPNVLNPKSKDDWYRWCFGYQKSVKTALTQISGVLRIIYKETIILFPLRYRELFILMMTSSNGTFSALLDLCVGNSPVTGEFPSQRPVSLTWINGWVNNRKAGDLRRHRAHYDVIVTAVAKRPWGVWYTIKTDSQFEDLSSAVDLIYQNMLNNERESD